MSGKEEIRESSRVSSRFMELEGLRGVAAIVVVIFHAILMFYPAFFYGKGAYSAPPLHSTTLESTLYASPLMGVLTGSFSVAIFFVLSGFVLTIGFLKKHDIQIIRRLAVKRYVRLMLPALGSILFAYFVMKLGLDMHQQAAAITHSDWLSHLWLQLPRVGDAFIQGLYGVFASGASSYNPVLWTIKYELIGSFIVFGAVVLFSGTQYRWIFYAALLGIFMTTWYFGFVIGMILADLFVHYRSQMQRIPIWLLSLLSLIAVGIGAFPPSELGGTLFNYIIIAGWTQAENISFYLSVAAAVIVCSALLIPRLTALLASKYFAILGKYTFSLYLVHMPVLFTLGAGIFVATHDIFGYRTASILSLIGSGLVLVPMVYLFERYVDAPSILLSSYLSDVYFNVRRIQLSRKLKILSTKILNVARVARYSRGTTFEEVE